MQIQRAHSLTQCALAKEKIVFVNTIQSVALSGTKSFLIFVQGDRKNKSRKYSRHSKKFFKNNAFLVLAISEGPNGVNRQMAKKLTVNHRQKRKIF